MVSSTQILSFMRVEAGLCILEPPALSAVLLSLSVHGMNEQIEQVSSPPPSTHHSLRTEARTEPV